MRIQRLIITLILVAAFSPVAARAQFNVLRNGDFQDDWVTTLAETKNHHWCYSSEFYNRRDYNPDAWTCRGSWQWLNADAAPGQRSLVMTGPKAEVIQRVNFAVVHDDTQKEGFPDAGGFPHMVTLRSARPERIVRDLTLRVRVRGKDVSAKAATVELGLCPIGGQTSSDPMGEIVAPLVAATSEIPGGTFDWQWIEAKLPASAWLSKATADKDGVALPGMISVAIRYVGAGGQIVVERAELTEAAGDSPNLLPNGGFEDLDKQGYPAGWGRQEKYRYVPPGYYYMFNTWHNGSQANRGPVDADSLIVAQGRHSLKMIVAAGDEKSVSSEPITLNQKEPRLIEVRALVKTDHLMAMQIDAVDEQGRRLDAFSFINKAPMSIGTNDWRQVRQFFRPRTPVKSVRLMLCARGVNGYTLDDTTTQPQNNVVGTIWWDEVKVFDPESTAEELADRGLRVVPASSSARRMEVAPARWNLGEQKLGWNTLHSPRAVQLELISPSGKRTVYHSDSRDESRRVIKLDDPATLRYFLDEPCPTAYTHYQARLSDSVPHRPITDMLWFGVWTTPLDVQLGVLYLQPEATKQFVRINAGFAAATMVKMASVRLEVVRRGTGEVISKLDVPATPAAIAAQREKVPADMRGDFSNLLLADVDVSALPVQPFNDPQRNWLVRATAIDTAGNVMAKVESQPFCRLAHEPPQPAIQSVRIDTDHLLYVNDKPWMPWGAIYGFIPVYAGPADSGPGKSRDFHNLPGWNIYDRFTAEPYNRRINDFNCLRYVAGSLSPIDAVTKHWMEDNLYCSSAFVAPAEVWSLAELETKAGGAAKSAEYLSWCKAAPMVVSAAPGVEEAFGLFHSATPQQIAGMGEVFTHVRTATGKPVMLSHGGGWNRFEFEKAPSADIYDPETEPLFPAPLHTDLMPLLKGRAATVWLRPQMYEDVPYERWRFHTWVELMRGCRGWQFAHGPGDQSLFRGLHGEMEFIKPVVYSKDMGPDVSIEPWIEHWSRRYNGKTYIIAATTRGLTMGAWRWVERTKANAGPFLGRFRVTGPIEDDAVAEAGGVKRYIHSIQDLPASRVFPAGSKLQQWVQIDAQAVPANLAVLVKVDGRWTSVASWGKFDAARLRDRDAQWFLRGFYHNTSGFLGWGSDLVPKAIDYVPDRSVDMGEPPKPGEWTLLELPLEKIGAADKLLSGVGFLHEGGRVFWGDTVIIAPDGAKTRDWTGSVGPPADELAKVTVRVAGMKSGAKVRVLFEDRTITAGDGVFTDDFRGQDLYQRYGGGWGSGYGDEPVALHIYEVPGD